MRTRIGTVVALIAVAAAGCGKGRDSQDAAVDGSGGGGAGSTGGAGRRRQRRWWWNRRPRRYHRRSRWRRGIGWCGWRRRGRGRPGGARWCGRHRRARRQRWRFWRRQRQCRTGRRRRIDLRQPRSAVLSRGRRRHVPERALRRPLRIADLRGAERREWRDTGGGAGGAGGGTAGAGGAQACGPNVCGPGTSCCNASCGICTASGGGCIQIACTGDGGIFGDAASCVASPAGDSVHGR